MDPAYRRKGVGTRLIESLFINARRTRTNYLRLQTLIHQDEPVNSFYRKMGFTPEREFITYTASIADQVLPLCTLIAARFRKSDPVLRSSSVVSIEQIFATGFARRCGCEPQWRRYRYAISF